MEILVLWEVKIEINEHKHIYMFEKIGLIHGTDWKRRVIVICG